MLSSITPWLRFLIGLGATLGGIVIIAWGALVFPNQEDLILELFGILAIIGGLVLAPIGVGQSWIAYREIRTPPHLSDSEAWRRWERKVEGVSFAVVFVAFFFATWGTLGRTMALILLAFLASFAALMALIYGVSRAFSWGTRRFVKTGERSKSKDST